MAGWSGMSAGARVVVLLLAGAIGGGSGYVIWREMAAPRVEAGAGTEAPVAAVASDPVAAPAPEVKAEPVAEPEPVAVAQPEPEPVAEPVPEAAPEVAEAAPEVTVDTWRVASDGAATVAGRTAPDAAVKVLVDGVVVAETRATGSGEFAALFTLAANPNPSLMTLVSVLSDGTEVALKAAIALGPIAGPEPVAVAEAPAVAEPAAEAPAALMLTEEGAVVMQDPAAETPAPVGPVAEVLVETIAYTAGGAVQLGGKGQPGPSCASIWTTSPCKRFWCPTVAGG